jgi:hypothetical protein
MPKILSVRYSQSFVQSLLPAARFADRDRFIAVECDQERVPDTLAHLGLQR